MSSDNQFTALGPTIIGFQTNGSRIQRGAEIAGTELGIRGFCEKGFGVVGTSDKFIGMFGEGDVAGVKGSSGNIGVEGNSPKGPGVYGNGSPGVFGLGQKNGANGNNGVMGVAQGDDGVAVFGGHRSLDEGDILQDNPFKVISFGPAPDTGAGVFGVSDRGGHGVVGRSRDGHGVLGRSSQIAGVVGICSHKEERALQEENVFPPTQAGVIGFSDQAVGVSGASIEHQGVMGSSNTGDGIMGRSTSGRGGVFQSGIKGGPLVAQVQLRPQPMDVPASLPAAPVMFDTLGLGSLPISGVQGDMLATQDKNSLCTLWFCVRGQNGIRPALWCQMLLGTPVPGSK
jgi:hypothetical protein